MTDGEPTAGWPSHALVRALPERPADPPGDADDGAAGPGPARHSLQEVLGGWIGELRRRWWLALIMFFLAFAPVAALTVLSIPTYTASGVVQVTSMPAINPLFELVGGGANASVETEIELMRRREFLIAVFKDLHLNLVDPHQPADYTLDLAVSLGGHSPVSRAVATARSAVTLAEVAAHHGGDVRLRLTAVDEGAMTVDVGEGAESHALAVGARLETAAFTLEFSRLPVEVGAAVELVLRSDGALFDELQAALSVRSVGSRSEPTNLVRVAFTGPDRQIAQDVVARVMQRYVEESLAWQSSSASRTVEFIATQLEEASVRLAENEEGLRSFAESADAVQLDAQARATIERMAVLESERLAAGLQEQLMDQVLGGMKGRIDRGKVHLTANFFDDPVLAASIQALTESEVRHELLKASLTPAHPQVIELAAQLKLQQQEVARLMRSARSNLATRGRALERQLKTTVESLDEYPDKQLQLARLIRAVEVSERLYSFLLEKYNEAEILKASTNTDKRVVDAASFPLRQTAPRRSRMLGLGVVAGLALAFAAVYIARSLQRRLGSVEAITGEVSWPVYGTIPALVPMPALDKAMLAKIWLGEPNATAEASRVLAINISLAPAPAGRGRLVQLTSSQPGEGKSTVVANLAIALARTGKRVLLIDLDLRRPVQHRIWGVARDPGYVELVARPSDPELARRIMHRDPTHHVALLTAGARVVDTTALVMAEQLPAMLAFWTTEYDYVLLDSPPAFVPDTLVIARHADFILLLARPGALERGELRRAVDVLERVPATKGLLLNAVMDRHLGYGTSDLGHYYTYGHSKDDATSEPPAA